MAQLNALKGGVGSSFSAQQPIAAAVPSKTAATSVAASISVGNKETAAKIAALERQIKDANSEARKAPLIAQLNALRGSSASISSHPIEVSATSAFYPSAPSSTSAAK